MLGGAGVCGLMHRQEAVNPSTSVSVGSSPTAPKTKSLAFARLFSFGSGAGPQLGLCLDSKGGRSAARPGEGATTREVSLKEFFNTVPHQ